MEVVNAADIFRSHNLQAPGDRTIAAYDGMGWPEICVTASEVGPHTGLGKTNSAHVRAGAYHAVRQLEALGQDTMLDSKFHDIPATVELSVNEATKAGASLITVHASGGFKMLEAAVKGAAQGRLAYQEAIERGEAREREVAKIGHVLGITVLTSLEDETYSIFGLDRKDEKAIERKVLEFVKMARDANLTGIVCSALEARAVREDPDNDKLLVVTPGITPRFAVQAEDQKRSTSAFEAIRDGADLIVVGRGINKASDYGLTKARAAELVAEEVGEGLEARRAA